MAWEFESPPGHQLNTMSRRPCLRLFCFNGRFQTRSVAAVACRAAPALFWGRGTRIFRTRSFRMRRVRVSRAQNRMKKRGGGLAALLHTIKRELRRMEHPAQFFMACANARQKERRVGGRPLRKVSLGFARAATILPGAGARFAMPDREDRAGKTSFFSSAYLARSRRCL